MGSASKAQEAQKIKKGVERELRRIGKAHSIATSDPFTIFRKLALKGMFSANLQSAIATILTYKNGRAGVGIEPKLAATALNVLAAFD